MSFCRWSTDDFQCDIYAYETDEDCFIIHVASNRPVLLHPLPPPVDVTDDAPGYFARHRNVLAMIEIADRMPINGPCDGATFECEGYAEFYAKMCELREMGYRVPDKTLHYIDHVKWIAEKKETP